MNNGNIAEVSSAEEKTQVVIPTVSLPKKEIERLNQFLLLKAGSCTSRKIDSTTILMHTCGSNYNFKEVNISYEVDRIGFKPNELVRFPESEGGGIALCIGVSLNYQEVFFLHEKSPQGLIYWPGLNTTKQFAEKGFAKISISAD